MEDKYNNKNFLNNQNYILGKTEKKILLSKFFVAKAIKYIFTMLSLLRYYIKLFVFHSMIFGIFSFFTIILLKNSFIINNQYMIFGVIGIATIMYSYFLFSVKKYRIIFNGINNLKELTFRKNKDIMDIVLYFISGFIISMILLSFILIFYDLKTEIYGLISTTLIFGSIFIDIFSLIFLPFITIYWIFSTIISFIYTFLFKSIKGYFFIKNKPKQNLLKKFDKIDKKEAENKYFKIKLKA